MYTFVRLHAPLPSRIVRRTHRSFTCEAQPLTFVTPPLSLQEKHRYVVISDLHVKRESVTTCVQALQIAHAEAVKRDAGILFLGDFWHARGALPVEPLNLVLKELESWSVPVVMIPGNHDLVSRTGNGVSLVPLATTLGADKSLLLTKPSVCLDALFLPYMHDVSRLKAALHHARHCLSDISAIFCHAEVAGARLADRIISPTSSRSISPSDFPPKVPVYSGHLHRPHIVSESIRYVGSPYQVSASEHDQQKNLLVLDREAGWTVADTIPIDIGPRHLRINAQSSEPLPEIRVDDRVTIQTVAHDDSKMKAIVRGLRERGIQVEVQVISDTAISFPTALIDDGDPFAPVEPRISPGALSNINLFEQYATLKNLEPNVTRMGKEILNEAGGKGSSLGTNISGKDVTIEWESVTLRGFGSFLNTVTYQLRNRGLVLVTGRDCNENGTATGRTNGTGKTTLVMSALWALTGRTDARPDGSVEKGVSLEMVHDDSKDCEVNVRFQLKGERVLTEAREMMNHEEREVAELTEATNSDSNQNLNLLVTRTSFRVGTASKTRSYRQGLHLEVNGVDLSCLDVKETQARIDRLVNGTLLPHTVFFGQHMGAGRGLVDSTDRTLKEHLALIFPLDIWKEARREAREKSGKLQEVMMLTDATLEADKAVVARLAASEGAVRNRSDSFERDRMSRIANAELRIQTLLASQSRSDEDSIAHAECLPLESSGLTRMIDDCKRTFHVLEERTAPRLDNRASAAAELARATASFRSAEDLLARVSSLVKKAEMWETDRKRRIADINEYLKLSGLELDHLEKPSVLDEKWKNAIEEVRLCEERYQELVSINITEGMATETDEFAQQLQNIHSSRQKGSALREEQVRLQTTLHEIRLRLTQSRNLSFVSQGPSAHSLMPEDSLETPSSEVVACQSCLRPFDGELYVKARSRLEEEAASIELALRLSEKKSEDENLRYEQAVKTLSERIDLERNTIMERKNAVSEVFSNVRSQRDSRNTLGRERQDLEQRRAILTREQNLYMNELLEIAAASRLLEEGDNRDVSNILNNVEAIVNSSREALSEKKRVYEEVMVDVETREQERLALVSKKAMLTEQLDDLQQLRSRCMQFENEKNSLKLETNPFKESLRMVTNELSTAQAKLEKRESEFSSFKDKLNVLKALDISFGPRGVPSFVLEEGLVWLEKLTSTYLHKLSAGELLLQIRAFSDYKSSNRSDGDNKEVISKKVFIRKQGHNSRIRERSLRQLSGGQRRRCSLAFALAFADLAHERAGFQSSLIVMDEILQSLDEDGRQRISKVLPTLMGEAHAPRDTIIVVTQDEAPEIAGLAHGGIDVVVRDDDVSSVLLDGKQPADEELS